MSAAPVRIRGLECQVCGREFDDIDGLRGHVDPETLEPCPGGEPR